MKKLSAEKMKVLEESMRKQNRIEHKDFKKKYSAGLCYICGNSLSDFREDKPCIHWVLRKNSSVRKHHVELVLTKFGLFSSQAYMRWVANEEVYMTNINDLEGEVGNRDLFNCTVKYKNIEWTIWCTENDYKGHEGSYSPYPHWHLQMQIDGLPFIKFNDFHIRMTEEDTLKISSIRESGGKIDHRFVGGESTQDVIDRFSPEQMLENMRSNREFEDTKRAPFHVSTVFMAKEGQLISGDLIADAYEESKRTGELASVILTRKLSQTTSINSIVSPSDNIPDFKERSGRRKK